MLVSRTVFFKKTCCKAKKNEVIKLFNDISDLIFNSWNSVYELKDGVSFDTSGILATIAMTAVLVNLLIASAP
jgi:hypothetical protein